MPKLFDRVKVNIATTGTGDVTFGSTSSNAFLTPTEAGCADTDTVRYVIVDGTDYEEGIGTIKSSVAAMARTTVTKSKIGGTAGTTKLNLSGTAVLALVASAADIVNKADVTTVGNAVLTATDAASARAALGFASPPQGRLTLVTGTPVMTTTQSAKTTIYYTSYVGNMVPVYDGTNMVPTAVAEISVATTDTTKNPAAIGASKVNDWFVWNDSGTLRLSHGPDWTNDTTRSAGTALVRVNGIWLNNASITNGPAASRGTYVGTTRSNGSSQLDWILGASGTAAFLGVWNAYNRRAVNSSVGESTSNWNYTSSTPRAVNGSSIVRATFVTGLAEDGIFTSYTGNPAVVATAGAYAQIGIGMDTTSTYDSRVTLQQSATGSILQIGVTASNNYAPQLGCHFVQALENSDNSHAAQFYGGLSNNFIISLQM